MIISVVFFSFILSYLALLGQPLDSLELANDLCTIPILESRLKLVGRLLSIKL
eukprot:XP_001705818.1 Hypothetical protein GL50803_113290 [Giardia lamblia ATCC 50803]